MESSNCFIYNFYPSTEIYRYNDGKFFKQYDMNMKMNITKYQKIIYKMNLNIKYFFGFLLLWKYNLLYLLL